LALVSILILCAAPARAGTTRETVVALVTCGSFEGGSFAMHDGMTFIRDAPITCQLTSRDPRGNGTTHSMFNANLDATMSGPVWGFDRYVSDQGGVFWWHFQGQMVNGIMTAHAEAHGEGLYEGLRVKISTSNGTSVWEIFNPGG
jgi:hypothetical protein